jgi:hypothetical protein
MLESVVCYGKLMGKSTSNYDETSPFMHDDVGSITTPIIGTERLRSGI